MVNGRLHFEDNFLGLTKIKMISGLLPVVSNRSLVLVLGVVLVLVPVLVIMLVLVLVLVQMLVLATGLPRRRELLYNL